MLHLASITIFPIKALDGAQVRESALTSTGALVHDRRLAMLDAGGAYIHGKRNPAVHRLRAEYDLPADRVRLRASGDGSGEVFQLGSEHARLAEFLSDYFRTTVTIVEDRAAGFPDDRTAPGPTVVSTQTLQEVGRWFGLPLDEVRRRFRANLEIDAEAPFWEDRLFDSHPGGVPFQIGAVSFVGKNPCARCVVPSRSTETGESTPLFANKFAQRREETLPPWAARDRFDHFYRLAINTQVATPAAGVLRAGDAVRIHPHTPHVQPTETTA